LTEVIELWGLENSAQPPFPSRKKNGKRKGLRGRGQAPIAYAQGERKTDFLCSKTGGGIEKNTRGGVFTCGCKRKQNPEGNSVKKTTGANEARKGQWEIGGAGETGEV